MYCVQHPLPPEAQNWTSPTYAWEVEETDFPFHSSDLVASFVGLHAYSLYSVSMKALATDAATGRAVSPPEEAEVIAETREDPRGPGVRPRKGRIEPR